MKIEMIYDQGTAKIREDQVIWSPPFSGVADGVSELYLPSKGPILFKGKTGGQMASETLLRVIAAAKEDDELEVLLKAANLKIQEAQDNTKVEYLAGAVFALAKVGEDEIKISQCGDCSILWVVNQEIGITENRVFLHDTEARRIIAELMEKHQGNREKMWREFSPVLAEMRRQHINRKTKGGYGLLNGQPKSQGFWKRITLPRAKTELLLLFTDGLIHYPESGNGQALAQKTLELFRKGGLRAILEETRKAEEKEKETSHLDHAEASAVAIEF